MGLLHEFAASYREGFEEGKRQGAVDRMSAAILRAVADGRLTDEETHALCNLYDQLGITIEEWKALTTDVWRAVRRAVTDPRELRGVAAFLSLPETLE